MFELEFCENQCSGTHSLLWAVNENLSFFLYFCVIWMKLRAGVVHRNLFHDNKFHENMCSESHSLCMDIREFIFVC